MPDRGRVLGVDGLRLLGQRTGVGRVLEALLRTMGEIGHPFDDVRVHVPAPLPDDVELPPRARGVVTRSALPDGLWEQLVLPRVHGRRHLLLCPGYVVPLLGRAPTLLIHHGSYEGYPRAFPWWQRIRSRLLYTLSARRATAIVTVSEHSRRDMVRFYRLQADKIRVVPDGVDVGLFRPLDDDQPRRWRTSTLGDDRPFLLYVGKLTRRRNLPALTEAFALWKRRTGRPHRLVFVGFETAGTVLADLAERHGLAADVYAVPYASHEELAVIYNAADLLVYPSSYEGFGMPVLEAMACGTPALALDRTAFPEFAQGVALLLPDAGVETLVRGIEAVVGDAARRRQMRRDGPERAARYAWAEITRRYLELMSSLTGGPP